MITPVRSWFPVMDTDRMIKKAHVHADLYGMEIGQERYVLDDARAVVNWLRHEHTNYDKDQTAERHQAACEAIAEAFPWLRDECATQAGRRAAAEQAAADAIEGAERDRQQARREHQALVEQSKQVIAAGGVRVGQKIRYRRYVAEIIKIGRSKVTVAYEIKTGKDRCRTATVHAARIDPIN